VSYSVIRGDKYTLSLSDCLSILPTLPDGCADLLICDPPYNGVLDEAWDNQWESKAHFVDWLAPFLAEFYRVLKANGTLFVFAYWHTAADVEIATRSRFHVVNHIIWRKTNGNAAFRNSKESLRAFIPATEHIIMAEHYGADSYAKGEAGYTAACDDLRGFVFEPLRLYLRGEWQRAGLTPDDANAACGTASMAGRHFFSQSQWCLPTAEHYVNLQRYINQHGRTPAPIYEEYHAAPRSRYEGQSSDYSYLRADYENLRADYENLRRHFSVTAQDQYSDVWDFCTSSNEGTYHPAQKPVALLQHMINSTTRPGATVLDPMMGSGTTGVACARTGRRFIGIELDPGYFDIAAKRIADAYAQPLLLPAEEAAPPAAQATMELL
jgi:site-specific DNA-methyltransferase (adenine-specific)